ncbi:MAG: metallophosphoesterase [Clostridiaceae bacterium]|jgi:Icc-related predicted phosphoesterase|nr:metallophosphoesterase [Clostridiaceae bacterium]
MKILVVADKENKYIWDHFDPERFKDVELIISCGDLQPSYLSFLVTMINKPVFYVHGNHDTTYQRHPPEGCDSIEDKIVTYKGFRFLGLGGSMMYSGRPHQYTDKDMEKRIRKMKGQIKKHKGFDVLVTHAPAYGIGDGKDLCHLGFKSFIYLMDKFEPKYMLHGHMHMNYGRQQRITTYNKTTIVNGYEYYLLDL